jgi:hypothetical protein
MDTIVQSTHLALPLMGLFSLPFVVQERWMKLYYTPAVLIGSLGRSSANA